MELVYTITLIENLVTLTFSELEVNVETAFITDTRNPSEFVEILSSNQIEQTIIFESITDAEYKITIQEEGGTLDYYIDYFLINKNALAAGNLLNKKDVNKIIKQSSVYNSSKLIDCLNRVAIANHRVNNYDRVNDILALIESVADNNCEEC